MKGYFDQLLRHSGIRLGTESPGAMTSASAVPPLEFEEHRVTTSPTQDPSVVHSRFDRQGPAELDRQAGYPYDVKPNPEGAEGQKSGNNSPAHLLIPGKDMALPNAQTPRKEDATNGLEDPKAILHGTSELPVNGAPQQTAKNHVPVSNDTSLEALRTFLNEPRPLAEGYSRGQDWHQVLAQARAWITSPPRAEEMTEQIILSSLPPARGKSERDESHAQEPKVTPRHHIERQELQLSIGSISLTVEASPDTQPHITSPVRQLPTTSGEPPRSRMNRYYLRTR